MHSLLTKKMAISYLTAKERKNGKEDAAGCRN
jgi:hypothetical protein